MGAKTMGVRTILAALALAGMAGLMATPEAAAQQTQSRLYDVTKSKKLRVCQFPLYYSISFRNPKSGEIEGIDADLAKELAKELDAKLEIVESSNAARQATPVYGTASPVPAEDRFVTRLYRVANTGHQGLLAAPVAPPYTG